MLVECVDELLTLLKVKCSPLTRSKIEEEVQKLTSENKFFDVVIDDYLKSVDKKTKTKIESLILKIKTVSVIEMINKPVEQPPFLPTGPLELISKFGPLIEIINTTGLIEKIYECHKLYIADNELTNEGLLKCIREIANSKELEDSLMKIDIKELVRVFNIVDVLNISQKLMPEALSLMKLNKL
jgi:hypothetical protein